MDPLVILSKPFHISKKINYLYLELERYKVMMNSIPQPNYGSIRIDKSPSKETPNQRALEKYYETQEKITAKERELELAIEEVNNYIDSIDNDEYNSIIWGVIFWQFFLFVKNDNNDDKYNWNVQKSLDWKQ